jgi:hypothetical protein
MRIRGLWKIPYRCILKFNDMATTEMMAVKTPEALPILPWEEKHKT